MKRASISFVALMLTLLQVSAFAQVTAAPSLMNFQGRLSKPDGTPVADANYSLRFSLWTAATGGTEKWNQTINPVSVRNGAFAVLLNAASPANLFDTNLWLEIKIGTDAPLTPRQQLVSVGYAMKANTVPDNSITNAKIANVDWSKITNVPPFSLTLPYAGSANTLDPAFSITNTGGGTGVYGQSTDGYGGYFTSNYYGVYGETTYNGGAGGFFTSQVGHGVTGQTFGANKRGVFGFALGAGAIGGYFLGAQGTGVWGRSIAGSYAGVYGENTQPTGYGGYFRNTGGGTALHVEGTASTGVLEIRGGADIAERFPVRGQVKPGMVVEIDAVHEGVLRLARGAYNPRIAGVVSGAKNLSAGVILTDPHVKTKNTLPIAMNGRVWVWCDASRRAIEPGSFLTSSDRPGYAMAATRLSRAQGTILGKAMTRLPKGKTGLVLALVNLH